MRWLPIIMLRFTLPMVLLHHSVLRCSLRKRSKVADDNEMPGADLLSALPITRLRRSVGISGLTRPGWASAKQETKTE